MGQGLSCRGSHEHGLFRAVQHGDIETFATLLDTHPSLMQHTTVYDRHSALHIAAANGQIQVKFSFSFHFCLPIWLLIGGSLLEFYFPGYFWLMGSCGFFWQLCRF